MPSPPAMPPAQTRPAAHVPHRARDRARRFSVPRGAEPFRLRDAAPHVHGVAWRHERPDAAVVLVHGLQSHAGWFTEAAEGLVDRGMSVYALDRRGSGSSPGLRGHIDRYEDWLDEVADVVALARRENPRAAIHLLGHCFGATVSLATVLSGRASVDSLIMLTPGLCVRPGYSPGEQICIAAAAHVAPRARFRVPQRDEDFTSDPRLLAWIRADVLGTRTVTAHALMQMSRMRQAVRARLGALDVPLLVIEADHDRIADNAGNRAMLTTALGVRRWILASFDGDHFLLAGSRIDGPLDAIAGWVATRGPRRPTRWTLAGRESA